MASRFDSDTPGALVDLTGGRLSGRARDDAVSAQTDAYFTALGALNNASRDELLTAIDAYNNGQDVGVFKPIFDRMNVYHTGGEAAPGKLTPQRFSDTLGQWAQDEIPGLGKQLMDKAAMAMIGYGFGGAAGLWGQPAGAGTGTGAGLGTGTSGGGVQTLNAKVADTAGYSLAPGASTGVGSSSLGTTIGGAGMSTGMFGGSTPATPSSNPGWMGKSADWVNQTFGTNLTPQDLGQLGGMLLNTGGSIVAKNQAQSAADTYANAQIEAAKIAADAAKFRPVGVTTAFGSSNFGYDANGNLVSAGYTPSQFVTNQQQALKQQSNQALKQYRQAQAQTAPMIFGGQRAMELGNQYLASSPQAQAQQWMADQQALLAPSRADQLAALQNQQIQQGRAGIAVGGNAGMMATNPELAAYYNALRQQDLELAANATQAGQQYAQFGANMLGAGGDLMQGAYDTQTSAFSPYKIALGGVSTLEGLAQNPMDLGTSIGAKSSTAAANAGRIMGEGMTGAAQTQYNTNKYSPLAASLFGAGNNVMQNYGFGNQNQQQTTNMWGY